MLGTPVFPILSLFLPRHSLIVLILLGFLLFLCFDILRLSIGRFNAFVLERLNGLMKAGEEKSLNGSTYVLLSELICFYFFEREVAFVSLFFLAIADPLTAIFMERLFHTSRIKGNGLAFLACFFFCLGTGFLLKLLGLRLGLVEILFGSLSASFASIAPFWLDDNVLIPVASAIAMHLTHRV